MGSRIGRSIRVLLFSPSPPILAALVNLLRGEEGIAVVADTSEYDLVLPLARRLQPHVLELALEAGGFHDLAFLRELQKTSPTLHVFLSALLPKTVVELERAARAGPHREPRCAWYSELVGSLRRIGDGGTDAWPPDAFERLTSREREVVILAAQGLSSTETGRRLGITARTAECHRTRGMRKLGLHRRAELVRFAIQNGWQIPRMGAQNEI
jgi:DNA-binding NarL/FixJ family response regulator